jgi:hypothetical protein
MKLYNLYWHDDVIRHHVVTTNNIYKWKSENNKRRIANGEEPERLSDFEIEEVTASIYSEEE